MPSTDRIIEDAIVATIAANDDLKVDGTLEIKSLKTGDDYPKVYDYEYDRDMLWWSNFEIPGILVYVDPKVPTTRPFFTVQNREAEVACVVVTVTIGKDLGELRTQSDNIVAALELLIMSQATSNKDFGIDAIVQNQGPGTIKDYLKSEGDSWARITKTSFTVQKTELIDIT